MSKIDSAVRPLPQTVKPSPKASAVFTGETTQSSRPEHREVTEQLSSTEIQYRFARDSAIGRYNAVNGTCKFLEKDLRAKDIKRLDRLSAAPHSPEKNTEIAKLTPELQALVSFKSQQRALEAEVRPFLTNENIRATLDSNAYPPEFLDSLPVTDVTYTETRLARPPIRGQGASTRTQQAAGEAEPPTEDVVVQSLLNSNLVGKEEAALARSLASRTPAKPDVISSEQEALLRAAGLLG